MVQIFNKRLSTVIECNCDGGEIRQSYSNKNIIGSTDVGGLCR